MDFVSRIEKDDSFIEGTFIEPYSFCINNYSKNKCRDFYNALKHKEKCVFHTCPYGMSTYVDSTGMIFTCMRERNSYDKRKNKSLNCANEIIYNPTLNSEQLNILINSFSQFENEKIALNEKGASIDSIAHEVKQLNAQIKERCDVILQTYHIDEDNINLSTEEINALKKEIRTIYLSSSMISSRFSLYDYEKNPDALIQGAEFPCNIYKKFDKIKKIFKNYMKKSIPITLVGSSYKHFNAYPTFELIPLLIIENAVKYSYSGNEVSITFKELPGDILKVSIVSYSPYCSASDMEHLFEKGFRGKNASRVSDGSGVGLYFVKMLCDLHSIDINITSDNQKISEISGMSYAPFEITLIFNKVFDN